MSEGERSIPPPGSVLDERLLQLDETGMLAQQDARTTELEARIAQLELLAQAHRAIDLRSREGT